MTDILTLNGVNKSFGAVVIANNLDLEVAEGEALGMLGPNGAGKTTLFGLITGTHSLDAGQVTFEGHEISRLSPTFRCRRGIARSFQVPQPFGGMTVFENLVVAGAFARGKRESDLYQFAAEILDDVGLGDVANLKAGKLSLLNRKRLELARALVTRPRLLLLDEVAGGLTEAECEVLIGLIQRIKKSGISIIWIEHIVHALLAVVDRVVVLAGGNFIANGPPDQAVQNPRVIELYMGIPAGE
jgi:branched-chain amino acid transport system ATP-binding protein